MNRVFKLVMLLKNGTLSDINVKKIYLKKFKIGHYVLNINTFIQTKSKRWYIKMNPVWMTITDRLAISNSKRIYNWEKYKHLNTQPKINEV